MDNISRPSHRSFLALHAILWSILGLLAYFLLNLPFYIYVILGLFFLIYKNTENVSKSVFIRESKNINVCVVGSGFSGLTMGIKLKEAGIPFVILEKSSEIGGTWYSNKYPGCACDVYSPLYQSYYYMNPDWSTYVCPSKEIKEYLQKMVNHFGLQPFIRTNANVKVAKWNEDTNSWLIQTENANGANFEKIQANFLVSGCGILRQPFIPKLNGLANFKGKVFHSSQWDESYDYKDKNVALIGSGATAVQIAPAIIDEVKNLHVFQRTPNWFFPKIEGKIPQWFKEMLRSFPFLMKLNYWLIFFQLEIMGFLALRKGWIERLARKVLSYSIRRQVKDEELARKLTPTYPIGCKRILLMNDFLPMFANKSNAHLVTKGIKEIKESSIVTNDNDQEIPVDLIIFATGFQIEDSICGFETIGKNNLNLRHFLDDFPVAFKGISVPNFPNFFILLGPNTATAHTSVVFMAECQVNYIMNCLNQMLKHDIKAIEVKSKPTQKFRQEMDEMSSTLNIQASCQGWYKNKDGINFILWPSNLVHYWWITRKAELLENYWLTLSRL